MIHQLTKILKSFALRAVSIMIAIGVIGLIFVNVLEVWGAIAHPWWETTMGTVIENNRAIYRTRGGRHWSDFTYRYEVDGQAYTSKRLWFFEQIIGPSRDELQTLLDTYPVDSDILVTYSPTFPQQAVIVAQVNGGLWVGVITAGFCIIPGFLLLSAFAVGLWQQGGVVLKRK